MILKCLSKVWVFVFCVRGLCAPSQEMFFQVSPDLSGFAQAFLIEMVRSTLPEKKTLAALRGNSGVQHKFIFQKKIVPLCLAKVDRLGHSALKSSSQVYRELDFSAQIRK